MKLIDLINAVKEQNLTKDQLEGYRDQLSSLFSQMMLEMADIEKLEAVFMHGKDPDESVANRKITWKATPEGQRLIQLKRYAMACKEMLSSLKNRLYQIF